ncbi:glycoside hydrolase family 79 protein [Collybia nuda]|uniref:Glycoside hydrolase family 79 protein n=1 Tax=Collybia nuda TaxID=64659 RepID=A0A9P6CEY7_9AGAR|nr:glycoside hydrolase family 79 protein [Collybia nuda]
MLLSALWGLCILNTARAVTVYGQIPLGQTSTASGPEATQKSLLAAYDETLLTPPPLPNDRAPTAFTLNLQANNATVPNLSIMQHGSFYGFSIEMSVITQLMGKNSSHLQVPFLNLLGNIQQRAGGVHIRLGGNTQDFAVYVEEIENHHALDKETKDAKNPTLTPAVQYTKDMFYMASNISSLVNVRWYLGIPFNDTNWRFQIAEFGQEILGDHLLGLQAGNEPDYYQPHGHRPEGYDPQAYFEEFADLIRAMQANDRITNKNMLIGPSLASGPWQPKAVWDTGYLDAYGQYLHAITMEHYPSNNCFTRFNVGSYVDPQETFHTFLNHEAGLSMVRPYLETSNMARALGKPFIMFETNTATCGGLPGISDSFGAALWALDYGFTMAATNFSGALLHVGGQNVYYNPFTAPPTNQTAFNQWTVGAVYYSVLIVAEAFGMSNTSQIVDTSNNGIFTPSYAIYDGGILSKVALFNFNDDPSGASDIVATVTVAGGTVPASVKVKYFAASSVSVKTNLTWAGQTLGNKFQVDGRMKGELDVITIPCDQSINACGIPVRAPGFALVFVADPAADGAHGESVHTFETSAYTKTINTATVDPEVLATSNGHSGRERERMGSTSFGSVSAARGAGVGPGVVLLLALMAGAGVVAGAFGR